MELREFKITKAALDRLNDKEKCFFVQISNLFHEINALHRVTIFSNTTSGSVKTVVERTAQNSQSFFFLEVLAAKLVEGWKMVKRDYYGSQLSKDYCESLTLEAKEALSELKRYFERPNNRILELRDQYVFHYSSQSSEKILDKIRGLQDEELKDEGSIYLSEWTSDCFFAVSEIIVTNAILKDIEPMDSLKALDKFFKEILRVSRWFLDFFKGIIYVILPKMGVRVTPVKIPDPPSFYDVVLPCFVKMDSKT